MRNTQVFPRLVPAVTDTFNLKWLNQCLWSPIYFGSTFVERVTNRGKALLWWHTSPVSLHPPRTRLMSTLLPHKVIGLLIQTKTDHMNIPDFSFSIPSLNRYSSATLRWCSNSFSLSAAIRAVVRHRGINPQGINIRAKTIVIYLGICKWRSRNSDAKFKHKFSRRHRLKNLISLR